MVTIWRKDRRERAVDNPARRRVRHTYRSPIRFERLDPRLPLAAAVTPFTAVEVTQYDKFGSAVAMTSDFIAVGAPQDSRYGLSNGAAYVFARNQNAWDFSKAQRLDPSGKDGDDFGRSVAIDGRTLVVGSEKSAGKLHSGNAYVFQFDGERWLQIQTLVPSDPGEWDRFGQSLAMSAGYLLVGTPQANNVLLNDGVVYAFGHDGTKWVETQKLSLADPVKYDRFGTSVSISGEYAVVGAPNRDYLGADVGTAYVFRRIGDTWHQQMILHAKTPKEDAHFGYSVAITGDYVFVGEPSPHKRGLNVGAVHVFRRNGGSWDYVSEISPGDALDNAQFGCSVSATADYAIVGACGNSTAGTNAGLAYILRRQGDAWGISEKVLPTVNTSDRLGTAVAIAGETAVVGAPLCRGTGFTSGCAFAISEFTVPDEQDAPSLPVVSRMDDDTGVSSTDGITKDNTPTFIWKSSVDFGGSGIAGYWWAIDDTTPETGGTFTASQQASRAVLTNGLHTFNVKAVDRVGNLSGLSQTTFQIDTTVPRATFRNVDPDPRVHPVPVVSLTFSEAVRGVDLTDFALTVDGSTIDLSDTELIRINDSEYRLLLSSKTIWDGNYQLRLKAGSSGIQDLAGNFLVADAIETWKIGVPGPEITIFGKGREIANGDATPDSLDGTAFGDGSIDAVITRTFVVQNKGDQILSLGSVEAPAFFTVTEPLAASLQPGASDSFTLQMQTVSIGDRSGTVIVHSNDPDEAPYSFAISGRTVPNTPEVSVSFSGINIQNGDATPSAAHGTDFLTVKEGGEVVTHTFTVHNDGNKILVVGRPTVPEGFSLIDDLVSVIPAGGSDTMAIRLNSSIVGKKLGRVSFSTTDGDENPFSFTVRGEVTAEDLRRPDVDLTGPDRGRFFVGQTMTIQGTASDQSGISHMWIELYKGGLDDEHRVGYILASPPGSGPISHYEWMIPESLNGHRIDGSDYRVKWIAWDASPHANSAGDYSTDSITILERDVTPPTVKFEAPAGGVYLQGEAIAIRGFSDDHSGLTNVLVELYKGGITERHRVGVIFRAAPPAGGGFVHNWIVPDVLNGHPIGGNDYIMKWTAWDASPNANEASAVSLGVLDLRRDSTRPQNDEIVHAISLTGSGYRLDTNLNATSEPFETAHGVRPGGASVWYRWHAPRDMAMEITTAGSTFDTMVAVYVDVGAQPHHPELQLLVRNDDFQGSTSHVFWDAADDTTYYIAVDGVQGATGTIRLAWYPDEDGDGIYQTWERTGVDVNGDGIIDLDLPSMGASPSQKDLFLELDAMAGRAPASEAVDLVIEAFAAQDIALHVIVDEVDLPLIPWPTFPSEHLAITKEKHFGSAAQRRQSENWHNIRRALATVVRYAVFADTIGNDTRSGQAALGGDSLIVSLGGWSPPGGTKEQQAGTLMHELGHSLGLNHGGGDAINCKPNYHSVMNYLWQFPRRALGSPSRWVLDYSPRAAATLDEGHLDEFDGIQQGTLPLVPRGPELGQLVSGNGDPVDWNNDGNISPGIEADINRFVSVGSCSDASPQQKLVGFDDWARLQYSFRDRSRIGAGTNHDEDPPAEITYEEYATLQSTGWNVAPVIHPVGTKTVLEGLPFRFTATAYDPDSPVSSLTFRLGDDAPAGVSVDSLTGEIHWRPSEEAGPSVIEFTLIVDDKGEPRLSDKETVTLVVLEANRAPEVAPIPPQFVDELQELSFRIVATDPDVPRNRLWYTLEPGAPASATIDRETGVISWVPTEDHGSGRFFFSVRVTDDGNPALSDVETMEVVVREHNQPPELSVLDLQVLNEGDVLGYNVIAIDHDLPANQLIYRLSPDAPSGAYIDATSGALQWHTDETHGGHVFDFTVIVTDDGTPAKSAMELVRIAVREVNHPPEVRVIESTAVEEGHELVLLFEAFDADLPQQPLSFALSAVAPPGVTIDLTRRAIVWTPTERQGPAMHELELHVSDGQSRNIVPISIQVIDLRPWQHDAKPNDVNLDGHASPLDALIVINSVNEFGSGALAEFRAPPPHYVDVNGDNSLTPQDALVVINYLHRQTVAAEGEQSRSSDVWSWRPVIWPPIQSITDGLPRARKVSSSSQQYQQALSDISQLAERGVVLERVACWSEILHDTFRSQSELLAAEILDGLAVDLAGELVSSENSGQKLLAQASLRG